MPKGGWEPHNPCGPLCHCEIKQRATECLRLAAVANDSSNEALLLELAEAWNRLAEQLRSRAEEPLERSDDKRRVSRVENFRHRKKA
jgi:hypothetical protein